MLEITIITAFKGNFFFNKKFFLYKELIEKKIINVKIYNLREKLKNNKIDHKPYGLEYGMLFKINTLNNIFKNINLKKNLIIYPTPSGNTLNNNLIHEILNYNKNLIFYCDRYEGTDFRFLKYYNPLKISIGDYIISNGELATSIILDSILRYLSLKQETLKNESFEKENNYLLDCYHFTKPRNFKNIKVPKILLSGNHKRINDYLLENKIFNTLLFKDKIFLKNKFNTLNTYQMKILIKKIITTIRILKKILIKQNKN